MGEPDTGKPAEPTNLSPTLLTTAFNLGIGLVQSYGWFIVGAFVLVLYLRNKFGSSFEKWQESREQQNHKKYDVDPDIAQQRLEAMERARQRMQEQLNAQAETYAEKQKRREEEKRQEKIENYNRHLEGKSYTSKYKPKEEGASTPLKPKPKKPLRQSDYNPLMGESSTFRAPRRSGFQGG
ncbi:selenoprotein S-like isoform X2 [Gigantopelta aegis]|uniref:selenoprotein S-like isoform X2 n=1 Tax=Gigantopelta aegis TaxID=1735272 RepID=UPI001B88D141|nr:selenoprotein S-like isoform X2 [Gigantopelta aegis]